MEDNNLTRALSIINKLIPKLTKIEEKRLFADRAQHFIDRYVDLIEKNRDVDYH